MANRKYHRIRRDANPFSMVPRWWLSADVGLTGNELRVCIALLRWANLEGGTFPSVRAIGEEAGINTDAQIRRALKGAEAKGLIVTTPRRGRSNEYVIITLLGNRVDNGTPPEKQADTPPENLPDTPPEKQATSLKDVSNTDVSNNKSAGAPSVKGRTGEKRSKRDLVWEALYEVQTGSPYQDGTRLTKGERDKINSARKQAKEVGATPEEVRRRAVNYRKTQPGSLTALALMANWTRCETEEDRHGSQRRDGRATRNQEIRRSIRAAEGWIDDFVARSSAYGIRGSDLRALSDARRDGGGSQALGPGDRPGGDTLGEN